MSFYRAWKEDAEIHNDEEFSISDERITKGTCLRDTYEVLSDAIQGGMGSVWRVHHNNWNVDLAMKRPNPRFFAEGSQQRKEEFIAECEHWINLGLHPNIAEVAAAARWHIGAVDDDAVPAAIEELAAGRWPFTA